MNKLIPTMIVGLALALSACTKTEDTTTTTTTTPAVTTPPPVDAPAATGPAAEIKPENADQVAAALEKEIADELAAEEKQ